MHFHLPKPLHGWREFVGEVGIIVVGVTIALAAEQVVEAIHLKSETHHARDVLREELSSNYLLAMERREVHACLNAQLDRMEGSVLQSGPVLRPMAVVDGGAGSIVYRAPSRPWSDNDWQNIRSDQVFANLPEDTREDLTSFYTQVAYIQRMNDDEDAMVGAASALGRPLPLDASVRSSFLQLLETERHRNDLMALIASQLMATVERLGDRPSEALMDAYRAQSGTVKFCKSRGLSA
jgi:hypothetical protein